MMLTVDVQKIAECGVVHSTMSKFIRSNGSHIT